MRDEKEYRIVSKVAIIYYLVLGTVPLVVNLLVILATLLGLYFFHETPSLARFFLSFLLDLLLLLSVVGIHKNKRWGWAVVGFISIINVLFFIYSGLEKRFLGFVIWVVASAIAAWGGMLRAKLNKRK